MLTDIQHRFGVRLKYENRHRGKDVARIRPYSLEESLTNVPVPFNYKVVKQAIATSKLKNYEYILAVPMQIAVK